MDIFFHYFLTYSIWLITQLHNTRKACTFVNIYTSLFSPSEEVGVIVSIAVMAWFSAKANLSVTHFRNGLSVYLPLKYASWQSQSHTTANMNQSASDRIWLLRPLLSNTWCVTDTYTVCVSVSGLSEWVSEASCEEQNTEILSARKSQHNILKTQNLDCTGIWSESGRPLELCVSKNNNNSLLCRSLHVEIQAYRDHRTRNGFLSRDAKNN